MRAAALPALALLVWTGLAAAGPGPEGRVPRVPHPPLGRVLFLEAERALHTGERQRFTALSRRLSSYPLLPYLRHAALSEGTDADFERFLEEESVPGLRASARRIWLRRLAREGEWERFREVYDPPQPVDLRCHQLTAWLRTRPEPAPRLPPGIENAVRELWLVPRSQDPACDPAFAAWYRAGGPEPELVWARISLALRHGEPALARYLGRFLPRAGAAGLRRWLRLWRSPGAVTARALEGALAGLQEVGVAAVEPLLSDLLARTARRDPARAGALLSSVRWPGSGSTPASKTPARAATEARVGVRLAGSGRWEEGWQWLERALAGPASRERDRVLEQALPVALMRGAWAAIPAIAGGLSPELRRGERWRYWEGRAALTLGREREGRALLGALASERSYYGFRAADLLGQPYVVARGEQGRAPDRSAPSPLPATAVPVLERVAELRALERDGAAAREWAHLLEGLDRGGLVAAAGVAGRRGWHALAIRTLARARAWDELSLRFPVPVRPLFEEAAAASGLDLEWLLAMSRQESAFETRARSARGALGMMQLMPATGRALARERGLSGSLRTRLLDRRLNLDLGARYLRSLLERFGGHRVLAIAAYNAGPARVRRWTAAASLPPADIWIEAVPFRETRRYVRRVLAYTVVYEYLLGKRPTRLAVHLRPLPSAEALAGSP